MSPGGRQRAGGGTRRRAGAGLALLGLLLAAAAAAGGRPSSTLHVEADRGSIELGEPVGLTIWLEAPAGVAVELPAAARTVGDFELLRARPAAPETLASGAVRHRQQWSVTAFRTGPVRLPPLAARLSVADSTVVVHSDTLLLDVRSVLAAAGADSTAELRGLKALVELPVPRRWWPLLAGALALAALVAGAVVWRRRRRRMAALAGRPAADRRPPHLRALDALATLRAANLPARGELRAHYTRLTGILWLYLEGRFGVRAVERTTSEILGALAAAGDAAYDAAAAAETRGLLAEADLVKFARAAPGAAAAMGTLERAVELVQRTARRGLPAAVAAAPGDGRPPAAAARVGAGEGAP